MEFKGTKGKWNACFNWSESEIEIGTKDIHNIALVNKEYEEAEANAQLIASAPELLQALQVTINAIRERGYAGLFSCELKYADVTIAQALGKEVQDGE